MRITIVGAGIIGCAVAHELASRGADVHILDMRRPGWGATQASAGILAPYIEGHLNELLRMGVRSLSLYDDFIARVSRDGGAVEYERTGTLQVATDDVDTKALEAAATHLQREGIEHVLLDGDAARQLEPALSSRVRTGLLLPQHGYVRVSQLMTALTEAATRRGVRTTLAAAERIESRGPGLAVVTANGTIDSDVVVLAAGSWSGGLAQPQIAPPPVRPVRGQLLHLRLTRRPLTRVVWGPDCYLVPWHDGSMLVGATVENVGFDESATAAGVSHLLGASTDMVALTQTAGFEAVRVGLRPGTPDELPIIGPSSTLPGLYYATGHYRNGVLLAPLTGMMVADFVLEGRRAAELEFVQPARLGL